MEGNNFYLPLRFRDEKEIFFDFDFGFDGFVEVGEENGGQSGEEGN